MNVYSQLDFVLFSKIRSKYPIACLDRARKEFEADLAVGYDIGCRFDGTWSRWLLQTEDERIKALPENATAFEKERKTLDCEKLMFVCGAWHGYAHNRKCQVSISSYVSLITHALIIHYFSYLIILE